MSTRTGAMPVERSYLLRAWIVASAVVVAAAIAISLLLFGLERPERLERRTSGREGAGADADRRPRTRGGPEGTDRGQRDAVHAVPIGNPPLGR